MLASGPHEWKKVPTTLARIQARNHQEASRRLAGFGASGRNCQRGRQRGTAVANAGVVSVLPQTGKLPCITTLIARHCLFPPHDSGANDLDDASRRRSCLTFRLSRLIFKRHSGSLNAVSQLRQAEGHLLPGGVRFAPAKGTESCHDYRPMCESV